MAITAITAEERRHRHFRGFDLMTATALLTFLLPYEFSPTVAVVTLLSLVLFCRGQWQLRQRGQALHPLRATAFITGVLLMYIPLQTHFDYYAQHMFFLHRLQHLFLHHLAPFLIALAAPGPAIMANLGESRSQRWRQLAQRRWLRLPYRFIQQPVIASFLFVALIYLWLEPDLHFYTMLNIPLYNLMNWSMAIDGLLFWWMIFNLQRLHGSLARYFGLRIVLLIFIMVPQILIGAYIALSHEDLYSVYAVCGRLWPISAQTDQQIGGLITWIPAAMMSILGILVLLQRWMGEDRKKTATDRRDTVAITP